MLLDEPRPRRVTESPSRVRRADDVGEEDRREDAIGDRRRPDAREELLDLVEECVSLGPPQRAPSRAARPSGPRECAPASSRATPTPNSGASVLCRDDRQAPGRRATRLVRRWSPLAEMMFRIAPGLPRAARPLPTAPASRRPHRARSAGCPSPLPNVHDHVDDRVAPLLGRRSWIQAPAKVPNRTRARVGSG